MTPVVVPDCAQSGGASKQKTAVRAAATRPRANLEREEIAPRFGIGCCPGATGRHGRVAMPSRRQGACRVAAAGSVADSRGLAALGSTLSARIRMTQQVECTEQHSGQDLSLSGFDRTTSESRAGGSLARPRILAVVMLRERLNQRVGPCVRTEAGTHEPLQRAGRADRPRGLRERSAAEGGRTRPHWSSRLRLLHAVQTLSNSPKCAFSALKCWQFALISRYAEPRNRSNSSFRSTARRLRS